MNWDSIRPAIKTLFGQMGSDPSAVDTPPMQVVWEDEPRPFTDPTRQAIMILNIFAVVGHGGDEQTIQQDLTRLQGTELQDLYAGIRSFTLSCRVESEIQTDTGFSYEYLERVRNALNYRFNIDTLHALNLAWIDALPTRDLSMTIDDRRHSIANLDIMFARRVVYQDPHRYGYIATAPLTGTLKVG